MADDIKIRMSMDADGVVNALKRVEEQNKRVEDALAKVGKTGADAGTKTEEALKRTARAGREASGPLSEIAADFGEWVKNTALAVIGIDAIFNALRRTIQEAERARELARKGAGTTAASAADIGFRSMNLQQIDDRVINIARNIGAVTNDGKVDRERVFGVLGAVRGGFPAAEDEQVFQIGAEVAKIADELGASRQTTQQLAGFAARMAKEGSGMTTSQLASAGLRARGFGINLDQLQDFVSNFVGAGGSADDALGYAAQAGAAGVDMSALSGALRAALNKQSATNVRQVRLQRGGMQEVFSGMTAPDGSRMTGLDVFRGLMSGDIGDLGDQQLPDGFNRQRLNIMRAARQRATLGSPAELDAYLASQLGSRGSGSRVGMLFQTQEAIEDSMFRAGLRKELSSSGVYRQQEDLQRQKTAELNRQAFPAFIADPMAYASGAFSPQPGSVASQRLAQQAAARNADAVNVRIVGGPRRVEAVPSGMGAKADSY